MSEEEGLSWGDDDPTAVASPASATGASVKRKRTGGTLADDDFAAADPDDEGIPGRLSASLVLVFLGILGGIYLLYTAGWIVAELNNPVDLDQPFSETLYTIGKVLAVIAPASWFAATLVLERRAIQRLVWLVIGVMVLVPWPFLVGGS